MGLTRLARFAWGVLLYNVGVILWGTYVRATGSGAGCGSHWPTCNGDIIPREPALKTVVEFTHRATSGLALISVVVLGILVFKAFPRRHHARKGAAASIFFMLTEAAVGAGLVLLKYVAEDQSLGRALFMCVHLINTFILLACITLTAWWVSGGPPVALRRGGKTGLLASSHLLMLLLGVSGAITALGDTLFPASSLEEGFAQDLSPTAHVLLRLRIFHPAIAILTAVVLVVVVALADDGRRTSGRLGRVVVVTVGLQLLAGVVNLLLLAPVPMQILHLLLADVVWCSMVLFAASVLRDEGGAVPRDFTEH